MYKNLARILIVLMATVAFTAVGILADEAKKADEPTFKYVGAKKCKTCHKAQHSSWLETKHAKAYDVLSVEEKKKPECVGCHVTGTTKKDVLLEGIQCEACHGPGSAYKSPKIMSKKKWPADPEKYMKMATEAGLIMPTEETCKGCHKKEGNPNFTEFDFAKGKPTVHTFEEKAEK